MIEEEEQKEVELGRGSRARKDVTYQEQLSERDWLKAIGAEEEGSDSDGAGGHCNIPYPAPGIVFYTNIIKGTLNSEL